MKNIIKKLTTWHAVIAIIFGLGLPLVSFANTLTYEPQLENQRNPNEYCAKCHNLTANEQQSGGDLHFGQFHGRHLSELNPNTNKPITCVSCHGNISENHRRGVKDVMRFQSDLFSDKKPMYTVEQQNQVCFACHNPEQLRDKFWPHDVHAMKAPCATCHTLHPTQDKMKTLKHKDYVKLCVDCHSKQQSLLKTTTPTQPESKDKK